MPFLLFFCLLGSYITLGLSLSCETCHAFRTTCNGNWETCPPEKDSCGFIQVEGSGLMQIKAMAKGCLRSSDCAESSYSINLGNAGQMFTQITCCEGKECERSPPTFVRKNTAPNGKMCPACYLIHSHECQEVMAECAGDEDHCFELLGTASLGGAPADMVMKGCTSSPSCNETLDAESIGTFKVVSRSSCTPAIVRAYSSAPASFGFLLQAFMGLLFLKVLG